MGSNDRLYRLQNEAPRSKLRGILSGIPPKPHPPSLSRATARSPRHFIGPKPLAKADPLCSKLQSILAKANEINRHRRYSALGRALALGRTKGTRSMRLTDMLFFLDHRLSWSSRRRADSMDSCFSGYARCTGFTFPGAQGRFRFSIRNVLRQKRDLSGS
jgi:hypothetical protein